jgi:hypothetical protein
VRLSVSYPAPGSAVGSLPVPFGGSASLALPASGQVGGAALDTAPTKGSVSISGTTATGPGGNSPVQTISVTIANPPAPTVSNKALSVAYQMGGSVWITPSGVYWTVAILAQPVNGAAGNSGNPAIADYLPAAGYYGPDSFTYSATGPGGTSTAASVSVATPPAPTVGNVSATALHPIDIALTPSGVYSSLSVASGPAHGSVSISGATATYAPVVGYGGADSFTYVANGPGGTSAPGTVSITVPLNHAPTAVADSGLVHSQNSIVISVLANDTDPDGDPLTVVSASASDGSAYVTGGGTQVGFNAPTVATRGNKTVSITYGVSDGRGGTASASFNVVVQTEYYD